MSFGGDTGGGQPMAGRPNFRNRDDYRKAMELEEARKVGGRPLLPPPLPPPAPPRPSHILLSPLSFLTPQGEGTRGDG